MTEDINNLQFGQLIDLNDISRMLIKKTANREPNVKENSNFKVFESF